MKTRQKHFDIIGNTFLVLWMIASSCRSEHESTIEQTCVPQCSSGSCGEDGCGNNCECEEGKVCDPGEQCVAEEECGASCSSLKWKCGSVCGIACGECSDGEVCKDGQCVCVPECLSGECGDDGCGGVCSCEDELVCAASQRCVPREDCTDTCETLGYICASVCGEACGECSDGESCEDGNCQCLPACEGAECGDDSCGGTCGTCEEGRLCEYGLCMDCVPACDGLSCGGDGCGGVCECSDGLECNEASVCQESGGCDAGCADVRYECGIICDSECGTCPGAESCEAGLCVCVPSCDEDSCGDDGCGRACSCAGDKLCNAGTQCVVAEGCTDTCEEAGWVCGELCGTSCGECAAYESCLVGACRAAVSCESCPLYLETVGIEAEEDGTYRIQIALEYRPPEDLGGATMMDIYIASDPPALLLDAEIGDGLENAGKSLAENDDTQEPWFETRLGTYRLSVISGDNSVAFYEGRLLTLTFSTRMYLEKAPLKFKIQRRNQLVVPQELNSYIQISPYDQNLFLIY